MIVKGIGFALLGIGFFLLITYVVMRLWNWLVASLVNGTQHGWHPDWADRDELRSKPVELIPQPN